MEGLVVSVYVENNRGQDDILKLKRLLMILIYVTTVLMFPPSATLIVQLHIEPSTVQHIVDYST